MFNIEGGSVYFSLLCGAVFNLWNMFRYIEQAKGKYESFALITSIYSLSKIIFFSLFWWYDLITINNLIGSIYFYPFIILMLFNLVRVIGDNDYKKYKIKIREILYFLKIMVKYARWVSLSNVAFLLISRSPQFFLANYSSDKDVAMYGVALTFISVFSLFNNSLRTIILPEVTLMNIKNISDYTRFSKLISSKKKLYFIICTVFILGISIFQAIFLENIYVDSIFIFLIMAIGQVIIIYIGILNTAIHSIGLPNIDAINNVLRLLFVLTFLIMLPKSVYVVSFIYVFITLLGEVQLNRLLIRELKRR
ncbi:hypothetical protein [Alkalihalobacillus sp. TS-13]|uniref:hypothetical protein n=1 Tax=Alkalihalobacillus sp. TS-13 TaxID=2842455 RepID=UPI001C86A718|nr:hypothetical protein [Alkalihalobacillus sp. TS-13]